MLWVTSFYSKAICYFNSVSDRLRKYQQTGSDGMAAYTDAVPGSGRLGQVVLLAVCGMIATQVYAEEPQFQGSLAATPTPAYRIGPEDVLEISVWREEELHREVLVRPDGGISFPLAGDIQVAGRTPQEVQDEITARIKKFIPEAVVTVSAKKISGYTIFVIGRVNKPGQFVVGRYVDVVQALTLAGGLSPYAAEEKIKVIRRGGGKEQTLPFNYAEIKKGKNLSQNILLQSGDVVVVP